jgi:hypothetical protein
MRGRLVGARVHGRALFDPFRFSKPTSVSCSERAQLIAKAAYFRAEKRGFAPGGQLEDWLAAESQIDLEINSAPRRHRTTPR